MKSLQKAGGAGALLLAASFILLILSNAVIQPSLGITGPADQADPAKLLPVASTLRLLFSLPILFALAFVLTTLGLDERLHERAPGLMRIATASGLAGAVLFLAVGMFSFAGLPALASVYSQNPAAVTPADLTVAGAVADGLTAAGIFAAGWFVLLASWTALRGGLSRLLSYLGLLFGAVSILAFAIPPFSLLAAVLGIVWSLWLGLVLWRS